MLEDAKREQGDQGNFSPIRLLFCWLIKEIAKKWQYLGLHFYLNKPFKKWFLIWHYFVWQLFWLLFKNWAIFPDHLVSLKESKYYFSQHNETLQKDSITTVSITPLSRSKLTMKTFGVTTLGMTPFLITKFSLKTPSLMH